MREDGLSAERREAFRASARAVALWERTLVRDLETALCWVDALRAVFGDPPVDERRWRGDDFRL